MAIWLLIGTPENWKFGFEHGNIWGFPMSYEPKWSEMQVGDVIVYYAMRSIKKLIGYGAVDSKMRSEQPFFPAEVELKRPLWPLRINFTSTCLIKFEEWQSKGYPLERRGVIFQRALQKLNEERGLELMHGLSGGQSG